MNLEEHPEQTLGALVLVRSGKSGRIYMLRVASAEFHDGAWHYMGKNDKPEPTLVSFRAGDVIRNL